MQYPCSEVEGIVSAENNEIVVWIISFQSTKISSK